MAAVSLLDAFGRIPDPRRRQGTRHPLRAVLTLVTVGFLCGCKHMAAVVQWGRDQDGETMRKLGFTRHGTPAQSTIGDLLDALDESAMRQALLDWGNGWTGAAGAAAGAGAGPAETLLEHVACDGKTLRGSGGHRGGRDIPCRHVLSAYAVALGAVLADQTAAATKAEGGEITAMPLLLERLVMQGGGSVKAGGRGLSGKVITGDAIHTQRSVCRQIVDEAGDYLLAVKENQPTLHREVVDVFRGTEPAPAAAAAAAAAPAPAPAPAGEPEVHRVVHTAYANAPFLSSARRSFTAGGSTGGRCG